MRGPLAGLRWWKLIYRGGARRLSLIWRKDVVSGFFFFFPDQSKAYGNIVKKNSLNKFRKFEKKNNNKNKFDKCLRNSNN